MCTIPGVWDTNEQTCSGFVGPAHAAFVYGVWYVPCTYCLGRTNRCIGLVVELGAIFADRSWAARGVSNVLVRALAGTMWSRYISNGTVLERSS